MFRPNPHFYQSMKMTMKEKSTLQTMQGRLDISARELWNSCEKTFFDIRITHLTLQSYSGKSLAEVCQQHEKEKKDIQPNSD